MNSIEERGCSRASLVGEGETKATKMLCPKNGVLYALERVRKVILVEGGESVEFHATFVE